MKGHTRDKLILAARRCLVEHGHRACTIKRIAGLAGVNHGLVHHYFGSKEELLVTVIRAEAAAVREAMPDRAERLVGDFVVPRIFRQPDRVRLLIEFVSLARDSPRLGEELSKILRLQRDRLRLVLGLEDETTAALVIAAVFGLAAHGTVDPTLPAEAAAQRLLGWLVQDARHAKGRDTSSDPSAPLRMERT